MPGQLWQECYCGTEPVCSDCENCDDCCDCSQRADDAKQMQEFEEKHPGLLRRLQKHHEDGAREHD